MNAHPASGQYESDVGLFVNMLPFLEQNALYEVFDKTVPSNSQPNSLNIERSLVVLKCPRTLDSELLTDLSDRFSGPAATGLKAQACDYSGNDGAYVDKKQYFGTIRLRVGTLVKERSLGEVTDGTSNTFLFWESVGDGIRLSKKSVVPINVGATDSFSYLIDNNSLNALQSTTRGSTKSYLFAWSGFRVGTVIPDGGRAINFSNRFGEPFSAHAGIVNFAFTDGAVRIISLAIATILLCACAAKAWAMVFNRESNDSI